MTTEQTLDRLAGTTSAAVLGVLEMLVGAKAVTPGAIEVLPEGADPLAGLAAPAVAANVEFVDAVEGENVLVLPTGAVRGLAAAMMGMPPEHSDEPLSELELSAMGEAMNQLMSAAAAATGSLLAQEVDIAPPHTRVVDTEAELAAVCTVGGAAVSASFSIFGQRCRLVHLVPPAFVMALTRALGGGEEEESPRAEAREDPLRRAALDVPVRLWAELGRARMPVNRAVSLAEGAVVELDQEADAPIELFVDGMRFATGRLVVTDEGELAGSLETVAGHPPPTQLPKEAA